MRTKFLLALLFTSFCLSFTFSSEKINIQKVKSTNDVSFVNLFDNHSVNLLAKKDDKKDGKGGFEGFVKKIAPYEKPFLYAAIGTTIGFGALFITGIILIAVGYSMRATWGGDWLKWNNGWYVEYAGDALLGVSWLFFLAAVACWVFWGLIQYGKKKGYVMNVFASGDQIGISIKL